MSGYAQRHLDVTFALGTGNFGTGTANTVKLTGLRISASIVKAGGVSQSHLQLRVYGMSLDLMNKLSTLGKPLIEGRNNTVAVQAYSTGGTPSTVFQGTINQAWSDFQAMPEVPFIVEAFEGLISALAPIAPASFSGGVDVATVMSGLASQMGVTFENNGVSVQLSNPYFPGTAWQQVQAAAQAADINVTLDNGVLAIWPKGKSREQSPPTLSPSTGLVGYPTITQYGIGLRCLYNPGIVFGAQVKVESSLTTAQGTWTVFMVAHTLESETPGGQWFTDMVCSFQQQQSVG